MKNVSGGNTLRRSLSPVQVAALGKEANRAYLVALRVCGSASQAEEIVQEAYMQLVKKPPMDLGYEQSVSFFLMMVRRIATNHIRGRFRRKRREKVYARISEGTSSAPEDATLNRETIEALRKALGTIRQDEREAVSLCFEQGMTQRIAGEILGVPEQTISDRVRRGLKKLRSLLVEQGYGSLAPLGWSEMGAVLCKGGIPLAPSELILSVEAILDGTAQSSRMGVAGASGRVTSVLWIGLVLGCVLSISWWIRGENAVQADPGRLIARWDFSKGPPKELPLASGHWEWKRDKEGPLGGMLADGPVELRLPVSVPSTPVVVHVKMASLRGRSQFMASLTGGQGEKKWRKNPRGHSLKSRVFSSYFLDQASFLCVDDFLCSVSEFQTRDAADRIVLNFENWKIQSIEVLHIMPNEIPHAFQDIEALKKSPGMKRVD